MLEIADIVAQAGAPESEFTRFASVTSDLIRFVDLFRDGDTQPRFRLRDYQLEFGPGGSTAPDVVLRRDSSTGLLHSLSSFQVGFANNSTGNQRNAGMRFDAAAQHGIEPHHDGSLWGTALFTRTGGEIRFGRYASNATAQNTLEVLGRFGGAGGFVVGSPTGGDKGSGGINATGVWVNNQAVWHAGNFDPATGLLASAGAVHRAWSAGSDIDSLLPGSTFGSILESVNSAHFVVGLRSNDTGDSFAVISKSSAAAPLTDPYNRLCLRVGANGSVEIPGYLWAGGGIDLKAQPIGEIATHFATWASDPSGTALTLGTRTPAEVLSDIGAVPIAGGTITGALGFGTVTRQMLNLWGTDYALGVQSSTWYARTAARFSFFLGGVHANGTENNPGSGGVVLLTFNNSEILYKGQPIYHAGNPPPGSGGPSVLAWKHVTVNATTGAVTGTVSSGGSSIIIEAHSDAHEFIARIPASLGSYSVRITVRPPVGSIDEAAHAPAFERIADESVSGVNHHTYHVWSRGNPYDVLQAAPVDRLCIEVIQ